MHLYYLPGSCALAPHIALEASGLAFEAVRVERGDQTKPAYLAVNPLGRVPALVTTKGSVLTEVPAILSLIADSAPASQLLPAIGDPERYEALRWLAFLSSTVHPAFGRLWRAERFVDDVTCVQAIEHRAERQLRDDYAHIDRMLEGRTFLVGNSVSVADFYLFVFGRWGLRLTESTRRFPNLLKHTLHIAELAATKTALEQQDVTFEGPKSGPG
ncbi:MAG: glutathione S-transferase N-terminal domain-containing protein [Alphaproteobacteria bacterium]